MTGLRLAFGGRRKLVLGVIHLRPLPGTPFYQHGSLDQAIERAAAAAAALRAGGADGCLVQTGDRVYGTADEADPARTAALALVVRAVTAEAGDELAVGVQMMRNALKGSLAVAAVAGGTFIRAGALAGATLTADGVVQPDALGLMRYRAQLAPLPAPDVIADVASMHYEWISGSKPAGEVAAAAQRFGAAAVAVGHPDERTAVELVGSVRQHAPGLPVLLAGWTGPQNAARLLAAADGAFVGRCLERGGWGGEIDPGRVREYVDIVRRLER